MQKTNISAQKIDNSFLETYGIVIATFQVFDKLSYLQFFQRIFLLTDIKMKVIFYMLFLILSNVNMQFIERELIWRNNTIKEAFLITRHVKLINKNEFAEVTLDNNIEKFMAYTNNLATKMTIYLV